MGGSGETGDSSESGESREFGDSGESGDSCESGGHCEFHDWYPWKLDWICQKIVKHTKKYKKSFNKYTLGERMTEFQLVDSTSPAGGVKWKSKKRQLFRKICLRKWLKWNVFFLQKIGLNLSKNCKTYKKNIQKIF